MVHISSVARLDRDKTEMVGQTRFRYTFVKFCVAKKTQVISDNKPTGLFFYITVTVVIVISSIYISLSSDEPLTPYRCLSDSMMSIVGHSVRLLQNSRACLTMIGF